MIERRGDRICVVHGHAKKPGSKTDKPKGSIINCYSIKKYGKKLAAKKAAAQHYAIVKSEERRGEHDEAVGSAVGVASVSTPVALHKPTIQYSETEPDDDEIAADDVNDIDIWDEFFCEGNAAHSGVDFDDVDPDQLRIGTTIEYEHTTNEYIARKIALDHLAEHKNYYTALIEMERKLEKEEKNGL